MDAQEKENQSNKEIKNSSPASEVKYQDSTSIPQKEKPKSYDPTNNPNPNASKINNFFKKWNKEPMVDRAMVYVTLLLVISTCILATYTIELVIDSREQTKIFKEQVKVSKKVALTSQFTTQKSLALAESSFVVTKRSNDIAQQNFEIGNRPYLGVNNFMFYTIGDDVDKAEFNVFNYGKIPALQIKTITQFLITKEEPLTQFILMQPIPIPKSPSLPPNAFYSVSQKFIATQEDKNNLLSGKLHLFYYGEISYTDIFKGQNVTTFCFEFNANAPLGYDYNDTHNDVK